MKQTKVKVATRCYKGCLRDPVKQTKVKVAECARKPDYCSLSITTPYNTGYDAIIIDTIDGSMP